MTEEEQARAAMAGISELANYDGPLERLGGLTNIVFRAGDFCLRIPGKGTEEYIDRDNEAGAARAAAEAGVSPEVIHSDPQSGIMVTRFIDDVTIWVALDDNGLTRVDALSRSRRGKGDWGVNGRRIDRLLRSRDAALGPSARLATGRLARSDLSGSGDRATLA